MSDEITHAILDTLRYADVFDYAIRPYETHRYLIGAAAFCSDYVFTVSSFQNNAREIGTRAHSQYLMRDGQT